jgi:hypothetical protein
MNKTFAGLSVAALTAATLSLPAAAGNGTHGTAKCGAKCSSAQIAGDTKSKAKCGAKCGAKK